jgi:tRNA(Ile2) C34 agmatinyltransferase TiaS
MKYLPLVMTQGPLLAEVNRVAAQDSGDRCICGWCGSRMHAAPDRGRRTVRCPTCARLQSVTVQEEAPWRLTPGAAEVLRRTRRWLRQP